MCRRAPRLSIQFSLELQFLFVIVLPNQLLIIANSEDDPGSYGSDENNKVNCDRVRPGVPFHRSGARSNERCFDCVDSLAVGIDAYFEFRFALAYGAFVEGY